MGQLIDRLSFVACASYPGAGRRPNVAVENIALAAARNNTDVNIPGCATMGEKLKVRPGADIVVAIVVRDPSGPNYAPYAFPNPSLLQIGIEQPINEPVLDHIDVIRGMVTGYRTPGAPDYAGEWPRGWLNRTTGETLTLADVPAAAKNATAQLLRVFNSTTWSTFPGDRDYKVMSFRIEGVRASQYVRLRGTNLKPGTPFETDADGNPLPDLFTNEGAIGPSNNPIVPANANLKILCTTVGSNVPANDVVYTGAAIDGCPNHLPVVNGQKYSAFDVAAWSDLWFYGNPIFIEVAGSTPVAGVK
jgi:hypothetical protein